MAGIGFELKKLFVGRGVMQKMRAYAYAGIICSGTMLLAVLLLLGIQGMAKGFGVPEHQREIVVCALVYALFFSMMLTACLQTLLSRYVADMLYQDKPERVMPSLVGASLLLMIPGGIIYALIVMTADELTLIQKLLNWILFMELIPTWLQMAYITAAKDYRAILRVFALGVGLVLGLAFAFLLLGMNVITAIMLALVIGYGVMLFGFMRVLLRYFPVGEGSVMNFISSFSQMPDLILTGMLGMAGAFVHILVMWFSPLGSATTGVFRQAATFDAAAFYAFLVTIPTNINFIVSVEVNFYSKYRRYFDLITGGGTVGQIDIARDHMSVVLRQELSKLTQVQVFFMIVYMVLMRYFLSGIGFTSDMTAMFQVMCVGYGAYAIGNCVMLLQLYFNDRAGALLTCAVFFAVNLVTSLLTLSGPPLFYGIGVAAGGIAMYLVSLPRLLLYVKRIDYHVFCKQPIFNVKSTGLWIRLAAALDARVMRRGARSRTRRKGPDVKPAA